MKLGFRQTKSRTLRLIPYTGKHIVIHNVERATPVAGQLFVTTSDGVTDAYDNIRTWEWERDG